MSDQPEAKPEVKKHWRTEKAELERQVADLRARLEATTSTVNVSHSGLEVKQAAPVAPVQPEVFFMHLVVGISAHQGMTAFDPDAQNGLLANGALAYDTYCRLVNDSAAVLAAARANMKIREKQLAEVEAMEAEKRRKREEHRARLAGLKGTAQVERMYRGKTAEEQAAIATAQQLHGAPNADTDLA